MKSLSRALLPVFFAAASIATAQGSRLPRLYDLRDISLGLPEQVPSGFLGVGARSMGMGGAQLAAANDGTALFWNPAALTRVPRVEFLGGIAQVRPETASSLGGSTLASNATFTRLNAAVLTAPYPVYRGALTFALGVSRPADYGYRSERSGIMGIGGTNYQLDEDIRQEGGLSQYAIGMGVMVSPTVSLGLSTVWYRGNTEIRRHTVLEDTTVATPDSFSGTFRRSNDINGVMITVGTTAKLPFGFQVGAVATPPVKYSIEGTWGDEYVDREEATNFYYDPETLPLSYKVRAPWQFGLGLAWVSYALTLSADVWYADWRQASFDGSPYDAVTGIDVETYFEDRYRETVRAHVGAELLLPFIQTCLRTGATYDPDPFVGPIPASGESVTYSREAVYYSVGAGWLIDRVLTVDVAFATGGDRYVAGPLSEKREGRRVYVSTAFRF